MPSSRSRRTSTSITVARRPSIGRAAGSPPARLTVQRREGVLTNAPSARKRWCFPSAMRRRRRIASHRPALEPSRARVGVGVGLVQLEIGRANFVRPRAGRKGNQRDQSNQQAPHHRAATESASLVWPRGGFDATAYLLISACTGPAGGLTCWRFPFPAHGLAHVGERRIPLPVRSARDTSARRSPTRPALATDRGSSRNAAGNFSPNRFATSRADAWTIHAPARSDRRDGPDPPGPALIQAGRTLGVTRQVRPWRRGSRYTCRKVNLGQWQRWRRSHSGRPAVPRR